MIEAGLTREEALSRFVVCTHHGALGKQDGVKGDPNYKAGMVGEREKVFVNNSVSDGTSLLDAMKVRYRQTSPVFLMVTCVYTCLNLLTCMTRRLTVCCCLLPIAVDSQHHDEPMNKPMNKRMYCTPGLQAHRVDGHDRACQGTFLPSSLPSSLTITQLRRFTH